MNRVIKRDQYYAISYTTGPQWLTLLLDLQPERIDDPYVTATHECPMYGKPEDSVVRNAVLSGTDQANAEFKTTWHPLEIRYGYSGNDNQGCGLFRWAAYNLVKELAVRGVDAIAQS